MGTATFEASVVRVNSRSKLGYAKMGTVHNLSFILSKAVG